MLEGAYSSRWDPGASRRTAPVISDGAAGDGDTSFGPGSCQGDSAEQGTREHKCQAQFADGNGLSPEELLWGQPAWASSQTPTHLEVLMTTR